MACGPSRKDVAEVQRRFADVRAIVGLAAIYIAAARWNGMTEAELVAPGSGRILAVDVDTPGVGRP